MPRVIAAINCAKNELIEVHRPDNGLLTSCLELSTLKYLLAELKATQNESGGPGSLSHLKGINNIADDDILGVSDKMLFYSKELKSSDTDETSTHNPFVVGKLDTESLKNFDFEVFQGYIRAQKEEELND